MARRVRASRNLGFSALHCFNILKKFVDPWTILQAKSRDDKLFFSKIEVYNWFEQKLGVVIKY
jgi:hypothetical protein